ncbi:MAG: stage II sporulation protein P [Bacillota bacterium]
MKSQRTSLARVMLWQGLLALVLLVFTLSIRPNVWQPAFGGSETGRIISGVRTPSVFDLLWSRDDLAKTILRMGFPIIQYLEGYRQDADMPSLASQFLGWFLGFMPRGVSQLAVSLFPGGLLDNLTDGSGDLEELEKDWGITPVLYTLPPGEGMPAAVAMPDKPMVAIYHTHATESYLPAIGKKGAANAFTDDMSKSVVQVGEMLVSQLEERYRIPCVHSKTVHDEDARTGAYYRSESTVKALLQKYPSCDVLLDIHRDSQPRNTTAVTIRGKPYARLLMVIGTNNQNWVENYHFARSITSKLEENYPGISRGILYASANYNQNYSPKALVVEVGGVDNTLAECKNSMEALAWAVAATILPAAPPRP